jgi:nucleoside-diphosphate-sugar epimerase
MILVTGATGFLGSYIVKVLVEKGYTVKAIHRNNKMPAYIPASISKRVHWVKGDVLDITSLQMAMEDVDIIIHAAGIVSFSATQRKEMYEVNIEGTKNIVTVALEKKVKRLIYISSISAIGITKNNHYLNEEYPWHQDKLTTHYAITKKRGENEVENGIKMGLNAIIINPSTILGFGDWTKSSCEIFKNIYNGFKWYSTGVSGFVDVEDVARVVLLLMNIRISSERFIINSENWTFKKLMETIADGFGKSRPNRKASPFLLSLAWRMEMIKKCIGLKESSLTKEIAMVSQTNTFYKNDKILSVLQDFSFLPVKQTIEKSCKRYLTDMKELK